MSARVGVVDPVVMDVYLPAGVAGPDPLSFDVRCFLVAHATGVILIDTGLPGSVPSSRVRWSELTQRGATSPISC